MDKAAARMRGDRVARSHGSPTAGQRRAAGAGADAPAVPQLCGGLAGGAKVCEARSASSPARPTAATTRRCKTTKRSEPPVENLARQKVSAGQFVAQSFGPPWSEGQHGMPASMLCSRPIMSRVMPALAGLTKDARTPVTMNRARMKACVKSQSFILG